MPTRRNYSQELLAKQAKGEIVVCSLEPHNGLPVEYKPRSTNDPQPWDAGLSYRFSGRECHTVRRAPVSQLHLDLFLRNVDRLFDGAFQMGQDDTSFDFTLVEVTTLVTALTADGLLNRHGDTYVLSRKGTQRLTTLAEAA